MIYPKPLFPGARVALIGASGPVPEGRLEPAVQSLASLGLEVVVYESCRSKYGYLSGSDELRAHDVNAAFLDPNIDGVLAVRGGYGAPRILPMLDYDAIAQHPKYFSGYSDVTALHTVFNQRCGFATYHTPMPSTELYKGVDDYTMNYVRAMMFGERIARLENPDGAPLTRLVGGCAEGMLCGGNLSLVASSLGTPYEIDTRGKLLFLEDVGESTYRIDGMLTHLRNSGKFDDCAGVILGAYTDCEPEHPDRSLSLEQIFQDLIVPCGKPVVSGLVCGHCMPTLSMPLGVQARLDAEKGEITLLW